MTIEHFNVKPLLYHLKIRQLPLATLLVMFLPGTLLGADSFEDWQKVSKDQNNCGGVYVPPRLFPSEIEAKESEILVFADQTELNVSGEAKLAGDVLLKFGNKALRANTLTLKRNPETNQLESVWAEGDIQYSEPDLSIWGEVANYEGLNEIIRIEKGTFRYYPRHARGCAQSVEVDGEKNVSLQFATYTTCAPESTTWLFSSRDIFLSPKEGRGVAKDLVLRVKDVPVFYFPYLDFPIDNRRKTGFLYPSFGTTSKSGTEVTLPFYWNIAPNYDATFTPRVLFKRGVDFQTQARYLTTHSYGDLQVNILPSDSVYRKKRRENTLSPPKGLLPSDPRITALDTGDNRFAFRFNHHRRVPHWNFDIDYSYVGDDNYFVDLGNDLNVSNTARLLQQGQLQYQGKHWTHLWRVQEHQILHPLKGPVYEEEYRRQPQWAFHANFPESVGDFTAFLDGEFSHFAHRGSVLTGLPLTQGQRYHLRPGISYPIEKPQGYVIPSLQWDFLGYDLTLGQEDTTHNRPDSVFRTIPLLNIDSGLFFEKDFSCQSKPFYQTLEPRLYYLYVPFRAQNDYPNFDSGVVDFSLSQLYRDNYFSGRDRVRDANQLSLSFTSRVVDRNSGQEMLRATIGEIYYFSDRKVTLCDSRLDPSCRALEDPLFDKPFSPIIGELSTQLIKNWHLAGLVEWEPNLHRNEKTVVRAYYQNDFNHLFNVSYYWLKVDPAQINFTSHVVSSLEQADVSIIWPLIRNWHFLGRYLYDFERARHVDIMGGLEYDGCCSAIQFVFSRYLKFNDGKEPNEYATGIYFQILLKGLSSVGLNSADRKLSKKIPGYTRFRERKSLL